MLCFAGIIPRGWVLMLRLLKLKYGECLHGRRTERRASSDKVSVCVWDARKGSHGLTVGCLGISGISLQRDVTEIRGGSGE